MMDTIYVKCESVLKEDIDDHVITVKEVKVEASCHPTSEEMSQPSCEHHKVLEDCIGNLAIPKHDNNEPESIVRYNYNDTITSEFYPQISFESSNSPSYMATPCVAVSNVQQNIDKQMNLSKKEANLKIRTFQCSKCDYHTPRKSTLSRHVKAVHLSVKPFMCSDCDYCTSYKHSLWEHIKSVHIKEKTHACSLCEYQANNKSCLDQHFRAVHLDEKPFKCSECHYCTGYKSHLSKHIRVVHLKEKPFKCLLCDHHSDTKNHLNRHVKAVHQDGKLKLTECNHSVSKKLLKAINKKQLFKCTECNYCVTDEGKLSMHINAVHRKDKGKLFKCSVCDYYAITKSTLTKHFNELHMK